MTLEERIEQALAEVRPYLESDGGGAPAWPADALRELPDYAGL